MANIIKIALLGLVLLVAGCGPQQDTINGQTMGTYYTIKYVIPKNQKNLPDATVIKTEIDRRLEQINDQMSTYRPKSELSRFNRSSDVGVPFTMSPEAMLVVKEAIRLHQLTDGNLDITIGPLVNLWGFGPEERPEKIPDQKELKKRLAWVGIDKLKIQDDALIKLIPELYLDLSSIAKGYAVDNIAEYLRSLSITNYVVDIGGDLIARGNNSKGLPWRIAIEKPNDEQQAVQEIIEPGSMAVATSGDYRNFFDQQGKRYSHTLDPKTGQPISNSLVSVTVLDPSCMTADGLATAFGVLGPEKSLALANQLKIPMFMLIQQGDKIEEQASEAFQAYLHSDKK